MKYEIAGIAHAVGGFTDTVRHYDVHLHRKGIIPYCGSIGFML